MASFLDRMFGRGGPKRSGATAKERLQFVLVHDRLDLPPDKLEMMKAEILAVISRYVTVENEQVEIALQKRERSSLLVAEVPFTKAADSPNRLTDDDDDEPLPSGPRPPTDLDDDSDVWEKESPT
ncbi:MAG: cell division topological specificity factor MinE [Blastochloris sp.]|nr:cell division topological specificity factor MinE [Blastochloris sp.]